MASRKAIIIGAGPAGLTAAYELAHKTDIQPIVYEVSGDIGGISKTINYKGNRIDLCFDTLEECEAYGRRTVRVEMLD